jgi:hypothetical protein
MRARALLIGLLPLVAKAEVICALANGSASYNAAQDQRPSVDALQLAGRVNLAVKEVCGDHCPVLALFRNATAPSAMLIKDPAQAKIVYSPQFFAAAYDAFGDNGIIAIIAHELGHALDATLGAAWVKDSWAPEVRADGWAGCILGKMKAAPGAFDASAGALEKYPPASHPNWSVRLTALRTGFTQCGGAPSPNKRK